jgi:CheY-like chemotaxis protein
MSPDPGLGGARGARTDRILVVDDDYDTAEVLSAILEHEGYEVRFALSANDALAIARDFVADVALLDIGLPTMTGDELAVALQAELAPCRCRFIAITGFSGGDLALRNAQAAFEAHLTKPVSLEQLLAVLTANRWSEPQVEVRFTAGNGLPGLQKR